MKSERVEDGPACRVCGCTNRESRSFCRRCGTNLKLRKPIKWARTKPMRREGQTARKTIRSMSDKRLSEREAREEVVRAVHLRDRSCQAGAVHALTGVKCKGLLDVHELIPRSQWTAGYLDVGNCVLICRASHDWVTSHAHGAHALGLRRWSWERSSHADA